jgi:hypothetical protein
MRRIPGWCGWALGGVALIALGAQALQAQQQSTGASATINSLNERLAALVPQIAYLKDRRDIFDTMKRYTRGADRHDKDLVRSAFWPEATISVDKPMTLDEYVDSEERFLSTYAAHQHHITGQTIDIQGDTAHVESYTIQFLVPRDSHADARGPATPGHVLMSEKSTVVSGRYEERWEKRNGEWKILVRNFVEDLELKGDTVDYCARSCIGTWDRNDLSYMRPLQPVTAEQRQARAEASKKTSSPVGASK